VNLEYNVRDSHDRRHSVLSSLELQHKQKRKRNHSEMPINPKSQSLLDIRHYLKFKKANEPFFKTNNDSIIKDL